MFYNLLSYHLYERLLDSKGFRIHKLDSYWIVRIFIAPEKLAPSIVHTLSFNPIYVSVFWAKKREGFDYCLSGFKLEKDIGGRT